MGVPHGLQRIAHPDTAEAPAGFDGSPGAAPLAGRLRPGAVALDVGCGAGELVYLLQASGIDATGLEPDEAYADFARHTLKVHIERGTVAAWQCPEARFDLVTMFHSLEHLSDPAATLSRIHSWLKPFGLLAIEVPNVESRCQAPRHRYHYAHLYSFSPGTLEALAQKAGFALVRHELSSDDGNVRALFRRLPLDRLPTRPADAPSTQYVRTMRILRRHTSVRHYLSRHPYLRPLDRLRQRRAENRLLSALRTPQEMLEWAAAGGMTSRLLH